MQVDVRHVRQPHQPPSSLETRVSLLSKIHKLSPHISNTFHHHQSRYITHRFDSSLECSIHGAGYSPHRKWPVQYSYEQTSEHDQNKLKVQLKLSIARLRMVQQKDAAIAKQQRRAMAQLLEVGHFLSTPATLFQHTDPSDPSSKAKSSPRESASKTSSAPT